MKKLFTIRYSLLLFIFLVNCINGLAQVAGDFQTRVSGNWSDFNSWNIRNPANTAWIAAVAGQIPTATTSVFVQAAQTISVDNASAVCNDLNVNGDNTSKIAFSTATSILNLKGNMNLFNTSPNCFGTWTAGAKIIFSGSGAQGFTNLSVASVFVNIEVNKSSGTLTTSSNFRFGSFTLTAGNFSVGSTNEIQGSSGSATITINGGTWTQILSTTKIFSIPTASPLPIGAIVINGGSMILATTNGSPGFMFSTVGVTNSGTLTLNNFSGGLTIATSISIDPTSTFNTALSNLVLPASVAFNGVVNYNHTGAQTINAASYSYLKLSGTGTKTLGGATSVAANGTLEMSGIATSPTLALGGNTLTVSSSGSTLIYSSSANQTASISEWNNNFQNVTINSGAGVSVSMAGLNKTINGTLTLTAGTLNIGAGGTLSLNGPLANTTGFIDGTNTSDLNIIGTTGGTAILPVSSNISLRNIAISGTRTLQMNGTGNINLNGSFSIASGATYNNGGESQIVNGTGGSISITGKFITKDIQGFIGSNTSIPGIIPILNSGCTIEYGLMGDQAVQGSTVSYDNITFSGSGTKTPSTAFSPLGTIYITGSAVLDASLHNIVTTSPNTTNLKMDGGRFILGTISTQPGMEGIYDLMGGVIQFNGSNVTAQTIRSGKNFYSIEVTGNNVGNSNGNLLLTTGGSFIVKSGGIFTINDNSIYGSTGSQTVTVENGGIFRCGNNEGFNGFTAAFTNNSSIHSNIENIILNNGSTIEYIRSGDQPITNANSLVYGNLILAGTGNKTAPSDTLTLKGNLVKSGTSTFVHNSGTILFDGGTTAQSYTSASEVLFNNLINNNLNTSTGLSVNNDIAIARQLTLNAGSKITLASGTITLKSTATNTANVAELPATAAFAYGTGSFIVDRYFLPRRAWRFLSVPVSNSTLTFHQAWQESQSQGSSNQTSPFGYGTQITDKVTPSISNGFDYYSSNGPSVKTYDASTNKWIGIASTNNTIETTEGLMTFVRGDRTAVGFYATPTETILRTRGSLKVGSQPAITINDGTFKSIGNPYASALDMRKIKIAGGADSTFYLWDPQLAGQGFGAYQTFKFIGNDFYATPGFGSYGDPALPYNYIQSGQAFFATATGSDGSLTFMENAKANADSSAVNNTLVFRPASSPPKLLRTTLYSFNQDGSKNILDGTLNLFGDNYSNAVDGKDAIKVANFYENLAIKREDKILAVEARNTIAQNDTILYRMNNMKTIAYQFEFRPDNLAWPGIEAFLQDSYSNITTPIDLNRSTLYNFNITSDSTTRNAGRFRIIFENAAEAPLPVTFSFIKAYEQNKNIPVEWQVENEKNIKGYMVEKSTDGQLFIKAATITAKGNNSNTVNYRWIDTNPGGGVNYYRVLSIDINGKMQYSNIVKVAMGKGISQFVVNPNPIVNDIISLQLINQPKGKYYVTLFNNAGQIILTSQIQHEQGSTTQSIQINKVISNGNYLLEVTDGRKNKTTLKVFK